MKGQVMCEMQKRGFTLIELVVISIIAMLLSITAPSLQHARERGKRAVCLSNLRAIGQAIYVYAHDHDDLLIAGDSRAGKSWTFDGAGVDHTASIGGKACILLSVGQGAGGREHTAGV